MIRLARLLVTVTGARGPDEPLRRGVVFTGVLAGFLLFAATYVPINHWSVGRPARVLYLPGEDRLPFIPEFEYLYVLSYFFPWLLVPGVRDARTFVRCALAFLTTLLAAYGTYLVFPVYLERPTFVPDSIATWLLALEYRDPSYNHFPSLHVALTWLCYFGCRSRFKGRWLPLLVISISLSTLFVKQHYVVDVVYGAGLAAWAWRGAGRLADQATHRATVLESPAEGAIGVGRAHV
jgi:membrane-associated phospholipid phosphatase